MPVLSFRKHSVSSYFDVTYFVRFILLFLALYYFNVLYIGIVDWRGSVYSPFLDKNLNYIEWLRNSILYTSNMIAHILGLKSYVSLPFRVKIFQGPYVETVYACLGLGIMSFWVAFVSAHQADWKRKALWIAIGTFSIWFINCWRIALLLLALQYRKAINGYFNHHTLFNIVAYLLIAFLVYLHAKNMRKNEKISLS